MKKLIILVSIALTLFSCQEEGYDLEIRNTDPILIVDGRIESNTGKAKIKLTRSTDFLGDQPIDYVSDASVFIKVDDGSEQELEYLEDGWYELQNIEVSEGTTYDLRIVHGQNEYTSYTAMKRIIPIELFYMEETFGRGPKDDATYTFNMILNIDLNNTNFYLTETNLFDTTENEFIEDGNYLEWDDEAYDSNPALFPYFVEEYSPYSIVRVRFSHITPETYDFYSSLGEVGGQNPSSLAPANPVSNISNGAIGNFGAFATFDTTIVIFP